MKSLYKRFGASRELGVSVNGSVQSIIGWHFGRNFWKHYGWVFLICWCEGQIVKTLSSCVNNLIQVTNNCETLPVEISNLILSITAKDQDVAS